MNEEIVYIAETKSFMVNGQLIKESELTQEEIIKLKSKINKNFKLITGINESIKGNVIL